MFPREVVKVVGMVGISGKFAFEGFALGEEAEEDVTDLETELDRRGVGVDVVDEETAVTPIRLGGDVEGGSEFFVQRLGFNTEPGDAVFFFFIKGLVALVGPLFGWRIGIGEEDGGREVFGVLAATPAIFLGFAGSNGEGGKTAVSAKDEVIFPGVDTKMGIGKAEPAVGLLQEAQVLDVADAVFAIRAEMRVPVKDVGTDAPRGGGEVGGLGKGLLRFDNEGAKFFETAKETSVDAPGGVEAQGDRFETGSYLGFEIGENEDAVGGENDGGDGLICGALVLAIVPAFARADGFAAQPKLGKEECAGNGGGDLFAFGLIVVDVEPSPFFRRGAPTVVFENQLSAIGERNGGAVEPGNESVCRGIEPGFFVSADTQYIGEIFSDRNVELESTVFAGNKGLLRCERLDADLPTFTRVIVNDGAVAGGVRIIFGKLKGAGIGKGGVELEKKSAAVLGSGLDVRGDGGAVGGGNAPFADKTGRDAGVGNKNGVRRNEPASHKGGPLVFERFTGTVHMIGAAIGTTRAPASCIGHVAVGTLHVQLDTHKGGTDGLGNGIVGNVGNSRFRRGCPGCFNRRGEELGKGPRDDDKTCTTTGLKKDFEHI